MALVPTVTIQLEFFEPAEYRERLGFLARNFPNFCKPAVKRDVAFGRNFWERASLARSSAAMCIHVWEQRYLAEKHNVKPANTEGVCAGQADNSEGPFVYTPEGKFIGDDAALTHIVAEKYGLVQAEPDLDGQTLQDTLRRLVEANTTTLRQRNELCTNGVPINEQAETRTQEIIAAFYKESVKPSEGPRMNTAAPHAEGCAFSRRGYPRGFKIMPGIRIERSIDGGARFALWTSPVVQKKNETCMSMQDQCQRVPYSFLLDATVPRGASSAACDFRVVLHDEPLSRNHLVLVPRNCIWQSPRAGKGKRICIAIVAGTSGSPETQLRIADRVS